MTNEGRTLFTLEERLQMAANAQASSPEAAAKLVQRLSQAMREINMAVTNLYLLFVEPYLRMGEYHYERHLE